MTAAIQSTATKASKSKAAPIPNTPVAEAIQKLASDTQDQLMELLAAVPGMNEESADCNVMVDEALAIAGNTTTQETADPSEWYGDVLQMKSLVRGALMVGDACSAQVIVLKEALRRLAELEEITGAVSWNSEGAAEAMVLVLSGQVTASLPAPLAALTLSADEELITVSHARRKMGLDALYEIDGLSRVLKDISGRMATTDSSELVQDYLYSFPPLAARIRNLSCVAMSVLDDDDSDENLAVRLEGESA